MRFLPFEEHHTDLLLQWLANPHVAKFWQEEGSHQLIWEKYRDLPKRHVYPYVVELENELIGYIQYYDATKVGGGWWPDEISGTFGVDLMIGDELQTGIGLGPKIIEAFMSYVEAKEPTLTNFIIDPEPANTRAIRAYEKVGFRRETEMATPNGVAMLMRKKI